MMYVMGHGHVLLGVADHVSVCVLHRHACSKLYPWPGMWSAPVWLDAASCFVGSRVRRANVFGCLKQCFPYSLNYSQKLVLKNRNISICTGSTGRP